MNSRTFSCLGLLFTAFAIGTVSDFALKKPVRAIATTATKPAVKRYAEVACRGEIGPLADWNSLRSEFLDGEIKRVLLSEKRAFDFKDLCPNYVHFDNQSDFWADLLKEIAGHVSGFRPLESNGDPVDRERVARGLFQIDEFSASRYRCDLRGIEARCALHDPRVGSGCALKIVNELASGSRQVSKSLAERWSVLRQRREVHVTFEKNESCTRPKARHYEPLKANQTAWASPRFQRPVGTQRTARDN